MYLVHVDATNVDLVGVLAQGDPESKRPILRRNRKLFPRASTPETEGLDIKWTLGLSAILLAGMRARATNISLSLKVNANDANPKCSRWCPADIIVDHLSRVHGTQICRES